MWNTAIDFCKDSLVESVEIDFFERIFMGNRTQITTIMDRRGVPAESDRLDFRKKAGSVREGEYFLFSVDLENKRQKDIAKVIIHGPLDLAVAKAICREYVDKRLLASSTEMGKRVIKKIASASCTVLMKNIVQEYATRILVSMRQRRSREHRSSFGQKEAIFQVYKCIIEEVVCNMLKRTKQNAFYNQDGSRDQVANDILVSGNKECTLLVVHKRDIYSVLFRQKLLKTSLSSLKPQFVTLESANIDLLLNFNFSVFCVDKQDFEAVNNKFSMINRIVGTAQDLEDKIRDTREIAELCKKPKIKKERLFNIIDGKTQPEAAEIIVDLLQSNRNDKNLEGNLHNIHKDKPLMDCDVYFADSTSSADDNL